jgi:hypothetical protein
MKKIIFGVVVAILATSAIAFAGNHTATLSNEKKQTCSCTSCDKHCSEKASCGEDSCSVKGATCDHSTCAAGASCTTGSCASGKCAHAACAGKKDCGKGNKACAGDSGQHASNKKMSCCNHGK